MNQPTLAETIAKLKPSDHTVVWNGRTLKKQWVETEGGYQCRWEEYKPNRAERRGKQ